MAQVLTNRIDVLALLSPRLTELEELAIRIGRATGTFPAIWFFAMLSAMTAVFILIFAAYDVLIEDQPFLKYPGVLLIAPMFAAMHMIFLPRRAHWRLKD